MSFQLDASKTSRANSFDRGFIFLGVVTFLAYWPALGFDFVNYDDPIFVNEITAAGLNARSLQWAVTSTFGFYQPVVWLSLAVDAQLGGGHAKVFHLTNVWLHTANVLLLRRLLRHGLPDAWAVTLSLFWAVHPVNVEAVAWVSERKGLLATLFLLLGTNRYLSFKGANKIGPCWKAVALVCLSLLCKPSTVVAPVLFAILQIWLVSPSCHRTGEQHIPVRRCFLEHWPLWIASIACIGGTFYTQTQAGAFNAIDIESATTRLGHFPAALLHYGVRFLMPFQLSILYPFPASLGVDVLAGMACGTVIAMFVLNRPSWSARSQFTMGALWFVVCVMPVCGIVRIGDSFANDRHFYLAGLGLIISLGAIVRHVLNDAGIPVLLACAFGLAIVQQQQLETWRNSEALWKNAVAVSRCRDLAHCGLGTTYLEQGRMEAAKIHLMAALSADPSNVIARYNLAVLFSQLGDFEAARSNLDVAASFAKDQRILHARIAWLYASSTNSALTDYKRAIEHAQKALMCPPDPRVSERELEAIVSKKSH